MTKRDNSYEGQVNAPEFPAKLAWLNTEQPLTLRALRGKIVLLDFWTYCCINCLHVLPDLQRLEQKYRAQLVVIGVHSGKFTTEKETENIRQAVLRNEITHPVINDSEMDVWQHFTARAWPTLVLINPRGKVVGQHSGEGIFELFDELIGKMVTYFRAEGILDETPRQFRLEREVMPATPLSFPGKVLADEASQRLFISDTNHHRIVITTLDGTVRDIIGTGAVGAHDGTFETATFNHPQGVALHDAEDSDTLFICDTENHLMRKADLRTRTVTTLAGTGAQARTFNEGGTGTDVALNSPWDALVVHGVLFIAMAGPHQIWAMDPDTGETVPFAGSGREDHIDGPLRQAALAQPSGLATDGNVLFVADSEISSIRAASLLPSGNVSTIVGLGLFDFGDVDGVGNEVRLQHPLGVAYSAGKLYVADTYNHKIKEIELATRTCRTLAGTGAAGLRNAARHAAQFNEPGGLSATSTALFIADTNNHAIRRLDLTTKLVSTLEIKGL